MPLSFTSSARDAVNAERKALVPAYVASMGEGMPVPEKEPMFRIRPRRLLQGVCIS